MIPIIPLDANKELFEPIELFGKPAIFTHNRIERKTLPPGMFAYDMRHGDNGDPVTVENHVLVNHYATAVLNRPIAMTWGEYRPLTPDDIHYPGDENCTLKDYMAKHPPQKNEPER